jgi:hypothetical protein
MSGTQIPNDSDARSLNETEKKPRGFKIIRTFEPVPADDDPEPVAVDDSIRRPGTDGNASGINGDNRARRTVPTDADEKAMPSEQNNVVMFDESKICPSRYFDSKTAEYTLLKDMHPDGSKRDFYMEFQYRFTKYRRDIYEGRLPPEAVFYDFPEELHDRTPEQVKEFFDRIVFSTGIGSEEPKVTPLGLHPLLFRLMRRIDSDKLDDVARRFMLMRSDAEKIRKRREEEAARREQEADKPGSSSAEAARNDVDKQEPAQSVPDAKRDQPMGMEGIPRREAAPGSSERVSSVLGLREAVRPDVTSPRQPEEEPRRPLNERQPVVGQAPALGGGGPVAYGSGQVGLLSGLWYGLGAAAHGIGSRIGNWAAPKDKSSSGRSGPSVPAVPDDSRSFPEVTNPLYRSVLDIAARDAAHGLDQDIEVIERDCRTLLDLAAWTREVATQGPVADALKSLEDLAARRGVSTDAVWKDAHAVAKGELQDRDVAGVAETLAKAIASVDTQGNLARMGEAKQRVESASSRILERIDREQGVDPSKAKRVEDALGSLKDANAAFEKPGEDKEIRRIAEMARRIAEAFKRLVNRLLGRGQDAEEAPAPPGP